MSRTHLTLLALALAACDPGSTSSPPTLDADPRADRRAEAGEPVADILRDAAPPADRGPPADRVVPPDEAPGPPDTGLDGPPDLVDQSRPGDLADAADAPISLDAPTDVIVVPDRATPGDRGPVPDGPAPDGPPADLGAPDVRPGDLAPVDGPVPVDLPPLPDLPDVPVLEPDVCIPGPEVCNLRDDNCDGRIDERIRCELYESCREFQAANFIAGSGVYPIRGVGEDPVDVYCDTETDGGGWTLVGSTSRQPLDDVGTDWYPDLTTLAPSGPNPGLWADLAQRFPAWDLRFGCRDRLAAADAPFDVDVSFYGTSWYGPIASARTDGDACFMEGNVPRADHVPPARRNNLTGELLPRGAAYASGVLEGEDACDDEGDFAVDFNDRGMDGDPGDGTDWGEDDFMGRCGHDGVLDGQWFVFARERTPREALALEIDTRIAVIGNEDLARGLQEMVLPARFLPDDAALPDRLLSGQFDVVVLSRVLAGSARATPALVDTIDRFVRQGGGLVTELDGALPFLGGYGPGFSPQDAPVPAGWFHALATGVANLGPSTPISSADPIDFLFRGVPQPLRDTRGTENFLGVGPELVVAMDLALAATFPGGPPLGPFGARPAIQRGNRCGRPVLFLNFDWGDALHDPNSGVRDLAVNLFQEAVFQPPFDVPYTCPVYLPPPARGRVMVCGDAGRDLGALLPPHFALETLRGCAPDATVQALVVTSEANLAGADALDPAALRAWVDAGGRLLTAAGRSQPVHDLVFDAQSAPGPRRGDCGGDPMPAVPADPADRFWLDVPWSAPMATGCGDDLTGLPDVQALGGWDRGSVSLGFRDLGRGRVWFVEADWTAAGPDLSEAARDLLRYLVLGRFEGLSFSGIRMAVPEQELLDGGFTPCLTTHFGSYEPMEAVAAQCDGDVLLLGCRPHGRPNLQLAAMGTRAEVLRDVGRAPDAAHAHNGTLWYYNPDTSWGFAPLAAGAVERETCDLLAPRATDRMCWEVTAGELHPGYRCGADTSWDVGFDRVVFHRRGGL